MSRLLLCFSQPSPKRGKLPTMEYTAQLLGFHNTIEVDVFRDCFLLLMHFAAKCWCGSV